MPDKACHGFGSTTQVGLIPALDRIGSNYVLARWPAGKVLRTTLLAQSIAARRAGKYAAAAGLVVQPFARLLAARVQLAR